MRRNIVAVLIAVVLSPGVFASEKKKTMAKPAKKTKAKVAREYREFPRLLTARELLAMGPVKRQQYFEDYRRMLNELDKMAFLKLGRLVASQEETSENEFVARYPAFFQLFEVLVPEAHAATCVDPRYPFEVGPLCGSMCAGRDVGSNETGRAVGNVYFCFQKAAYQEWSRNGGYTAQLNLPQETYDALNFKGSWPERKEKILEAQRRKALEVIDENDRVADLELGQAMKRMAQAAREKEIAENIDRDDAEAGAVIQRMRREAREKEIAEAQDLEDAQTGAAMKRLQQEAREREIAENIDREDAQTGAGIKKLMQEAREREIAENIDREDAQTGAAMKRMQQEAREREIADNIDREDAQTGAAMKRIQQEAREKEIAEAQDREDAQTGAAMKRMQQQAREKEIAEAQDREDAETGAAMKKAAKRAAREKEIAENQDREDADRGAAMKQNEKDRQLREQTRVSSGNTPDKGLADGKCSPAKLSCTDRDDYLKTKHTGALKTFRASKPVNCVSAGNMSKYSGNQVKAGNCEVVRDFCIRKEDCAKPPADAEGGFKTRYSCPAGQAICSPFSYGLETKAKAICVAEKGRHLTEACDDMAKKLKGKPGYVGDFIATAPAGVAEAWDEYAQSFNGTCKQKTESQDAHCLECGIIGRRLQEARALASGSCTDALGYKQIKPGTGGTPATAQ